MIRTTEGCFTVVTGELRFFCVNSCNDSDRMNYVIKKDQERDHRILLNCEVTKYAFKIESASNAELMISDVCVCR